MKKRQASPPNPALSRETRADLHDLLLLGAGGKSPLDLGVSLLDEQAEPGRRARLLELPVRAVGAKQYEPPLASAANLEMGGATGA